MEIIMRGERKFRALSFRVTMFNVELNLQSSNDVNSCFVRQLTLTLTLTLHLQKCGSCACDCASAQNISYHITIICFGDELDVPSKPYHVFGISTECRTQQNDAWLCVGSDVVIRLVVICLVVICVSTCRGRPLAVHAAATTRLQSGILCRG